MPYSMYRMLVLASVLPLAERVREGSDPKPCYGIPFPVFANTPILSC